MTCVSYKLERKGKLALSLPRLLGGSARRCVGGAINPEILSAAGSSKLIQSLSAISGPDSLILRTLTILSYFYLFQLGVLPLVLLLTEQKLFLKGFHFKLKSFGLQE